MLNGDESNYDDKNIFPTKNFEAKFSDIYISTQTKIGYLDKGVNLEKIYWKLPIINYKEAKIGIIKTVCL